MVWSRSAPPASCIRMIAPGCTVVSTFLTITEDPGLRQSSESTPAERDHIVDLATCRSVVVVFPNPRRGAEVVGGHAERVERLLGLG